MESDGFFLVSDRKKRYYFGSQFSPLQGLSKLRFRKKTVKKLGATPLTHRIERGVFI
jgi:hypothetical protein